MSLTFSIVAANSPFIWNDIHMNLVICLAFVYEKMNM